jgi:hypothetical protein
MQISISRYLQETTMGAPQDTPKIAQIGFGSQMALRVEHMNQGLDSAIVVGE